MLPFIALLQKTDDLGQTPLTSKTREPGVQRRAAPAGSEPGWRRAMVQLLPQASTAESGSMLALDHDI